MLQDAFFLLQLTVFVDKYGDNVCKSEVIHRNEVQRQKQNRRFFDFAQNDKYTTSVSL